MLKKLQVSIMLKQSVKNLVILAICLLALTNFTYSQVYDLSLINGISSAYGPDFCPGDEVRVNSAIYNVGDIEACNIEITAYIPEGMTLSANPLNTIWTVTGSTATTTITECIPPGGSYPSGGGLQLSLVQNISSTFAGSTINFYTEISADDGDDIDSTPDTDPDNDRGAEPNTDTDNSVFNPNDEDDHDVAQISLAGCDAAGCTDPCAPNYNSSATSDDGSCESYSTDCNMDICAGDISAWSSSTCGCTVSVTQVLGCTDGNATNFDPAANCSDGTCEYEDGNYDLALIKGISSTYGTEYCPGDAVRFNMAIYNQGDVEACDVEITEYIPEGMSLSNDIRNSVWDSRGSILTTTINSCIPPGGVYPNITSKSLSVWLIIDQDFEGSSISNYAEISSDDGNDVDSTPDQVAGNDSGADPATGTDNTVFNENGDEDDHDITVITIKPSCTVTSGCTDPCAPNYNPASVNDDGSCGTYSTTCNDDICAGDLSEWNQSACGCQVTTAQVLGCTNTAANNYDANANCDDNTCTFDIGGCTDAAACNYDESATTDNGSCIVVAAATISGGPFTFCVGDGIADFVSDITVSGGEGPNTAWVVTDDQLNILGLPSMPGAVNFEEAGNGTCLIWYVTFNDITGADVNMNAANLGGCFALSNSIEVTREKAGCTDPAANNYDSSAGCDDSSCTYTQTDVIDLSLVKTLDRGQPVISPCDDVVFTVKVCNEGTVTVYDVEVTDIIPAGFRLSHGDNLGWVKNSTGNYSQSILGGIAPGACVSLPISIKPELAAAPGNYANNAVISSISDSAGNIITDDISENNSSSAEISIVDDVFDLALIMYPVSGQPTDFSPGDDVAFNISIYNRGGQTASSIVVTNYIPAGMSFNTTNSDNDNWVDNGDGTATISLGSSLLPCRAVSFPIILTIDDNATPGTYTNVSEISAANDTSGNPAMDTDSTMDTDPNNDAGGNPNSPSDNQISGDGTGFPGSTDYNSDEDDSDPSQIIVSGGLFFGNVVTDNQSMRLAKTESVVNLTIDRLYPTIATNKLNLIVDAADNVSTTVQILSYEGKVISNEVFQLNENLNSLTFDVSNLPKGMYFLNTITGEQILVKKFVKN